MSLSIGIIGLPNVGKSTLFQALTQKKVDISNYPFCTVDPNIGVVGVPDERLDKIARLVKPEKKLATTIEFVDIAGLVKGAHKGEGLGNQFLSHIREVDAICHVVRFFENPNISHISGEIKPLSDIETVNTELTLADLEIVQKQIEKARPKARSGEKEAKKKLAFLEKIKNSLDKNIWASKIEFDNKEKELAKSLNLLTLKPVLYVANLSENQLTKKLPHLPFSPIIPISCQLELELAVLDEDEKKEYLASLGLEQSQLDVLIKECYKLLDLVTFFTVTGGKEVRAWPLGRGKTVFEAAARVHTDFQEKFKKAEVIHFEDFINVGSEIKAKEEGLVITCGKDYIVEDGDIIKIKI